MERLFSIEEAAKHLGGISVHTVKKMLTKHQLRRTKVGRRTFIRESQLERVIKDELPATTEVGGLDERSIPNVQYTTRVTKAND